MALKTVTGKITRPDGIVGAVSLRIVLSAPAAIAGTQEVVPAAIDVTVAPDGTWSQQLQANLDLLPATTSYTALETIGGVTAPFIFVVPQSAGPFKLADILAAAPAPSPPAALDSAVVHLANPENITGVKTFSAAPVFSTGFSVSAGQIGLFGSGSLSSGYAGTFAGQLVDVRAGTGGAPEAVPLPLLKANRYVNLQGSQIPVGNGIDEGALFSASVTVPATAQVQGTAVFGIAKTQSSSTGNFGAGGQALSADAQGVVGIGQALAGSTRVGIGGFFEGAATGAGGQLSGMQVNARNNSGADASVAPTSFSQSQGLWISSVGTSQAAEAISIGNPSGAQFDVGLHANGQVAGGFTGPIASAFIQDDSTGLSSILINGTHTRAIGIKAGAGPILIGHTNSTDAAINANALIEAYTSSVTGRSLIAAQGNGVSAEVSYKVGNSAGSSEYFVVGTAGHFLTGSAQGDTGVIVNTAAKRYLIGGTNTVVSVTQGNLLGFFGAAEVAQIGGGADVLGGLVSLGLFAASANPPLNLGTGLFTGGGLVLTGTTTPAIHDSTTGLDGLIIDGTHTRAIGIKNGGGAIAIGHTNATDALTNASAFIELFSSASVSPILALQGNGNVNITQKFGNSSGSSFIGAVGATNNLITGSAIGDMIWVLNTVGQRLLIGPATGPVLKIGQDSKVGFFGAATVAQQATTGTAAGFTANAGTAVQDASTFTGGTGASAYRISDIVLALKNYGLLAA